MFNLLVNFFRIREILKTFKITITVIKDEWAFIYKKVDIIVFFIFNNFYRLIFIKNIINKSIVFIFF